MPVVAPLIAAPLLARSPPPADDWRVGAPFFAARCCSALAVALATSARPRRSRFFTERRPVRRTRHSGPLACAGFRSILSPLIHVQPSKILILDFGSQVTQLIARRIREAKVFCEVHASDVDDAFVRDYANDGALKGVILSGSHASTYEDQDLRAPQAVFELGVPVLGICYGMFAMTVQLGGAVEPSTHREFGFAEVRARGHTALLDGIADHTTPDGHGMLKVWMSHGDKVTSMPPGFALMASTPSCPIAGIADDDTPLLRGAVPSRGDAHLQGRAILERFVLDLCGARPDWVMRDYVEEAVASVRAQVGADEVILGLSGGVDSSVAAALIHRAIGDQLTCVFVDHGLLRLGEAEQVMRTFADHLGVKVIHVDAGDVFLGKLEGVDRSGGQAQDHRPRVRRGVPGRVGEAAEREVARAGHDLSGRHRVGVEQGRQREEGDDDQEPSQRRRVCPRRCT